MEQDENKFPRQPARLKHERKNSDLSDLLASYRIASFSPTASRTQVPPEFAVQSRQVGEIMSTAVAMCRMGDVRGTSMCVRVIGLLQKYEVEHPEFCQKWKELIEPAIQESYAAHVLERYKEEPPEDPDLLDLFRRERREDLEIIAEYVRKRRQKGEWKRSRSDGPDEPSENGKNKEKERDLFLSKWRFQPGEKTSFIILFVIVVSLFIAFLLIEAARNSH